MIEISRGVRRDGRMVISLRLSATRPGRRTRIQFLETAFLGFPHGFFRLGLQRMEPACPVSLHEQPDPHARHFAQVGEGELRRAFANLNACA